jgi:hypothetical protein
MELILDLSVCRSPCGVSVIRLGEPLNDYSVKSKTLIVSIPLMKEDYDLANQDVDRMQGGK